MLFHLHLNPDQYWDNLMQMCIVGPLSNAEAYLSGPELGKCCQVHSMGHINPEGPIKGTIRNAKHPLRIMNMLLQLIKNSDSRSHIFMTGSQECKSDEGLDRDCITKGEARQKPRNEWLQTGSDWQNYPIPSWRCKVTKPIVDLGPKVL